MESTISVASPVFRQRMQPCARRAGPSGACASLRAIPLSTTAALGLLGVALCALALPLAAQAQTLDNAYWVNAIAYFPKVDTNVRVATKTQTTIATDIDFEKDLALDDSEVLPSVSAGARFGRVIVGADFFKLNRNGSVLLARDISFDGAVYPAALRVESGFDSNIYRLTVGYAVVQNSSVELGAAIGVHATRFKMSIAGTGALGGALAQTEVRRRSVLAPLPTVGAFVTYKLAPRVELNGRFDWLSLKIDNYDGRLVNAQASASYALMRNLSIGAAYRVVDYRLGVDKTSWDGRIRYKLHGPAIMLQASF